jgi:hypothetical protein
MPKLNDIESVSGITLLLLLTRNISISNLFFRVKEDDISL